MSVRYESACVGCAPDLPCLGSGCTGYTQRAVYHCDSCDETAEYAIDGNDLCYSCAKEYLTEYFKSLTVQEMADLVNADFSYL